MTGVRSSARFTCWPAASPIRSTRARRPTTRSTAAGGQAGPISGRAAAAQPGRRQPGEPGAGDGNPRVRALAHLMRYCEDYVISCSIEVWRGSETARVEYKRGEISGVTVGGIDAPERLAEVMQWSSGNYRLIVPEFSCPPSRRSAPSRRRHTSARPGAGAVRAGGATRQLRPRRSSECRSPRSPRPERPPRPARPPRPPSEATKSAAEAARVGQPARAIPRRPTPVALVAPAHGRRRASPASVAPTAGPRPLP